MRGSNGAFRYHPSFHFPSAFPDRRHAVRICHRRVTMAAVWRPAEWLGGVVFRDHPVVDARLRRAKTSESCSAIRSIGNRHRVGRHRYGMEYRHFPSTVVDHRRHTGIVMDVLRAMDMPSIPGHMLDGAAVPSSPTYSVGPGRSVDHDGIRIRLHDHNGGNPWGDRRIRCADLLVGRCVDIRPLDAWHPNRSSDHRRSCHDPHGGPTISEWFSGRFSRTDHVADHLIRRTALIMVSENHGFPDRPAGPDDAYRHRTAMAGTPSASSRIGHASIRRPSKPAANRRGEPP